MNLQDVVSRSSQPLGLLSPIGIESTVHSIDDVGASVVQLALQRISEIIGIEEIQGIQESFFQKGRVWFACKDGEPVGYVTVTLHDGKKGEPKQDIAYIPYIVVLLKKEGSTIGRNLLLFVIDTLRKEGFRKIKLDLETGKEKLESFYQGIGREKRIVSEIKEVPSKTWKWGIHLRNTYVFPEKIFKLMKPLAEGVSIHSIENCDSERIKSDIRRINKEVDWEHYNANIAAAMKNRFLWIAEINQKVVGYALVYSKGQKAYVPFTAFDKEHQGKGIATALFRRIIVDLMGTSVERLQLHYKGTDQVSSGFYKHLGRVNHLDTKRRKDGSYEYNEPRIKLTYDLREKF